MRALLCIVVLMGSVSVAPTRSQSPAACGLDRRLYEMFFITRMYGYEATGDSWSPRAARWRYDIGVNLAYHRTTPALDAAFARYSRYCGEGDAFMAGLTTGERIGLALRDCSP